MPAMKQMSAGDVFTADPENQNNSLSDRELQDRLIDYLTDANLRCSGPSPDFLNETQADRAQRFSRFLARRYYRDRLYRGFHYSKDVLKSESGPAEIVESPQFDAILAGCVLGSLVTAKAVGNLVLSVLRSLRSDEWWSELLEYEFAFFLQLATLEVPRAAGLSQLCPSTIVREFQFRIPDVLRHLKSGDTPVTDVRGSTVLLFSRTPHGKIYVVELDVTAAAVVRGVDGKRTNAEIAGAAGIALEEATRILAELSSINAIVSADGNPLNDSLT